MTEFWSGFFVGGLVFLIGVLILAVWSSAALASDLEREDEKRQRLVRGRE